MKADEAKGEAIERAVARVRDRLDGDAADRMEAFVHTYAHSAPEDVVGVDPVDLYGAALAHHRLTEGRSSGETIVRVYTPRPDEHGWQSAHSVVEVVIDDMPFIVDSVRMELARHDLGIFALHHPIIDGVSYTHVEVDRQSDHEVVEQLERDLRRVLDDVRAAVDDWRPMRDALHAAIATLDDMPAVIDGDEVAEVRELLEWMGENHFTFLGYREYELTDVDGEDAIASIAGTGLGILRDDEASAVAAASLTKLTPEIRALVREPTLLNLTKANAIATVHRPSPLDYVGIKTFDDDGDVTGERRFLGLFTADVYTGSPTTIPVLRRKVAHAIERAALPPGGHAEKDLLAILETFPRDELLQIDERELFDVAMGILHLQERRQVRLFIRRDRYGRFYSCLVYLPRERYNTDVRIALQRILMDALHGTSLQHEARVSESVLARLHIVVHVEPGDPVPIDVDALQARLAAAVRDWVDDLRDHLVDAHGEDRGIALLRRYRDAFSTGYRAEHLPGVAVADIERLETLDGDDLVLHLTRPLEAPEGALRFRLYRSGAPILISDVLPLLENMGVRVTDQKPHVVRAADGDARWIYDFGLECDATGLERRALLFQEAFARVWRGDVENDGFNRLVVRAGLSWRDITMLRAYAKYLRQAGTTFTPDYVERAVAAHGDVAALLVELFHTRFAPLDVVDRDDRATGLIERIERALEAVVSLDEDRILRSFLTLIRATLRTSFFQRGPDGEPRGHFSLKLDPTSIPELPRPRPMFEIFVYSPRVEGVHLRGGSVARGGLRWSDRREDFRTEVLGLMKAQMVKNAVIVPVGAKGGFVVKRPPAERDDLAGEVEACYRTFIGGLLDITDNVTSDGVEPPRDVVRYDGDDPYLVVAADKGTATFSDLANEVAGQHNFWLGDAFASGGSAGYDHKRMGITARGAWKSVERHFRELGRDVMAEPSTVVGIGDMSGDVFGNGMLLSRQLKLVAAFNHLHVFLDPDPDPVVSVDERRRLFDLPRSTWADYDATLISHGGGVFERSAKSIPLSPEVRAVLDIDAESLAPNEVVQAILRAPVDLLWNGGIGTYVKAAAETHGDVGDRANDGVRVDARDLRCRVVGEGGNLGFTQRARVELARAGSRINTDAIDNSAGVDCSDHEVNIKILLDAVVAAGDMTTKQRNELLATMTDEVAELVLDDNVRQTQALSNAVAQSASLADVHTRYMRWLEQVGDLDRALEFLPGDDEMAERRARGEGLVAPELAVLLAYTKNTLKRALLDSDLPDDRYLERELVAYFPAVLRERFPAEIAAHALRREIIATAVASDLVDHQGITYMYRLIDETGAKPSDAARAYVVAREVFDMRGLRQSVEALDGTIAASVQTELLLEGRKLVERATRWVLRHRASPIDIGADVELLQPGIAEVAGLFPRLLVGSERAAFDERAGRFTTVGVPRELAERVASYEELFFALDVVEVAIAHGEPVADIAALALRLDDELELRWLRDQVNALPRDSRWQTLARLALREDLYAQLRALTAEVLEMPGANGAVVEPGARIARWLASRSPVVARVRQVLGDIRAGGVMDLATLSVALRETHALLSSAAPAPPGPPARTAPPPSTPGST